MNGCWVPPSTHGATPGLRKPEVTPMVFQYTPNFLHGLQSQVHNIPRESTLSFLWKTVARLELQYWLSCSTGAEPSPWAESNTRAGTPAP